MKNSKNINLRDYIIDLFFLSAPVIYCLMVVFSEILIFFVNVYFGYHTSLQIVSSTWRLVGFFCSIGVSAIVMILYNIYACRKDKSNNISTGDVFTVNTDQQISAIDQVKTSTMPR
jgi:hypothetical protein